MKTGQLILSVAMALVGLSLVACYASEGKTWLALVWALAAAVNTADASLKGVVVWAERR